MSAVEGIIYLHRGTLLGVELDFLQRLICHVRRRRVGSMHLTTLVVNADPLVFSEKIQLQTTPTHRHNRVPFPAAINSGVAPVSVFLVT